MVLCICGNGKAAEKEINEQKHIKQEVLSMTKTTVNLQAINDVKEFVNIVMKYDFDIDLVSGRYAIDAKSIMGIFSLDLSKPIQLNAHTDNADAFLKEIDKFIVK
jgi:phosphotransferase system HPr-like phosphotransfer protein